MKGHRVAGVEVTTRFRSGKGRMMRSWDERMRDVQRVREGRGGDGTLEEVGGRDIVLESNRVRGERNALNAGGLWGNERERRNVGDRWGNDGRGGDRRERPGDLLENSGRNLCGRERDDRIGAAFTLESGRDWEGTWRKNR